MPAPTLAGWDMGNYTPREKKV